MTEQDGDFQTLSHKEGSVGKKGGVPAGKLRVWDVLVEVPMSPGKLHAHRLFIGPGISLF